jgi:3-oxoacyl-[acyl-carrier protein] reductase
MDMRNKIALVTGSTSGIGRGIVEHFASLGARVVVHGLEADLARDVGERLRSAGHDAVSIVADLADVESCRRVVRFTVEQYGGIDILVNNAATVARGYLEDAPVEIWDLIMHVNLRAPFLITQALAKAMIAAKRQGAFIFIGSGAGQMLRTNGLAYCASKRALEWLMKGVALELAPHGIRANLVAPGLALGSAGTDFPAGYAEAMAKRVPLGRGINPGELSEAVMFLASERAAYITGASLSVDGGGAIPRRALD